MMRLALVISLAVVQVGCSGYEPNCAGDTEKLQVIDWVRQNGEKRLLEPVYKQAIDTFKAKMIQDNSDLKTLLTDFETTKIAYEKALSKCMSFGETVSQPCMIREILLPLERSSINDVALIGLITRATSKVTNSDLKTFFVNTVLPRRSKYSLLANRVSRELSAFEQLVSTSWNDASRNAVYTLDSIRIRSIDKDTKTVVCAARITATVPKWGWRTESVDYVIERTVDGKPFTTVTW